MGSKDGFRCESVGDDGVAAKWTLCCAVLFWRRERDSCFASAFGDNFLHFAAKALSDDAPPLRWSLRSPLSSLVKNNEGPQFLGAFIVLAEREGFEPPEV